MNSITKYITVTPALIAPTIALTASPLRITPGNSAILTWKITNANRCVLQYGSSEQSVKAVNGSKTVTPAATTTYRLWCVNDPGTGKDGPSAEASVTVTVALRTITEPTALNSNQIANLASALAAIQSQLQAIADAINRLLSQ